MPPHPQLPLDSSDWRKFTVGMPTVHAHLLELLELGPPRVQVQAAPRVVNLAASRRTLHQGHERAGRDFLADRSKQDGAMREGELRFRNASAALVTYNHRNISSTAVSAVALLIEMPLLIETLKWTSLVPNLWHPTGTCCDYRAHLKKVEEATCTERACQSPTSHVKSSCKQL